METYTLKLKFEKYGNKHLLIEANSAYFALITALSKIDRNITNLIFDLREIKIQKNKRRKNELL